MRFRKTKIQGVYIIEPEPKKDKRGHFIRVFCKKEIENLGMNFNIVQVNRSFTRKKGTIRGIHYQTPPYQEEKIVQCLKGEIYNVVLDLRRNSHTFGKWISEKLSERNKKMILVPKGCANGIQALTNNCQIEYFMSEYYSLRSSSGIRWDDPFFKIKWPLKKIFLSKKDRNFKNYNDINK